jgi:prepilin peptidase CpaA
MFSSSAFGVSAAAIFVVLLVIAGVSDLRSRRIPNSLVAVLALLGIGYSAAALGSRAGAVSAFAGAGIGLAVWLPFYALHMVGAGDVKFFAAGSVWLGPRFALYAAALSAILGGVLALIMVLRWRMRPGRVDERVARGDAAEDSPGRGGAQLPERNALPYGIAMSAALGAIAWFQYALR